VVINEIMYNPLFPESSYVELFNRSTNYTFNLSGWRLNGIDFTFPHGTLMAPRSYLVIAKNRQAFAQVYGTGVPVLAEFAGQLDDGGETLTLLAPGSSGTPEVVIDRVTYDDDAPWLSSADGMGPALQLIDPDQDNSRVSNWGEASGWRFFSYTGSVGSLTNSRLSLFFTTETNGGDVYLDDLALVGISGGGAGTNLVRNGDFESGLLSPWTAARLATNSAPVSTVAHSRNQSLHLVFNTGVGGVSDFYQELVPAPATGTVYTLSFWFLSGKGTTNLNLRVNTLYRPIVNVRPALTATPGTTNATLGSLPPYPPLWLSEVQPENLTGITDNVGDREPWIELHNAGSNALSLDGLYLADNFANLTQWGFPPGAAIGAGQYLVVWADGEPGENDLTSFHTSFRLSPTNGTVALSRRVADAPQILDYFNYRNVAADRSYGAYPPAQASYRQGLYYPTPGSANNPTAPPVTLFINEWMAANQSFLTDPMDGNFDDWFEIYNPNTNAVDLTGFRLTDTAASPNKFTVPTNIFVPPQGFLLVWADEDSGQTRTNGDLHVNFRLSQNGEAIQLRDPLGRLVDAVTFGPQTNNLSQGRYPDGTETLVFMTTPTPRAANVHAGCSAGEIRVLSLVVDLTTATLAWTAQPGCTYRVQFKDDLGAAAWNDLPGDVTAESPVAIKSDTTVNGSAQRFYRIVAVGN
jgi:hypothetical protein